MTNKTEEARVADTLHTLETMNESWSHDDLSIDEMCNQIDCLSDVISGDKDYAEFTEATHLLNN